MASIYIVRHGQASFGAENYDELSPLGCRQSQVLGSYLRDCGIAFDAVYSGDLSRQRKTAKLAIAAQKNVPAHHIDARFNEINNQQQIELFTPIVAARNPDIQALLEKGLSASKDYQKIIEAVFNYWVSSECQESQTQSWQNYSSAVHSALDDIVKAQGSGKTVGLFASGGTIATIVTYVLGLAGEQAYTFYEPVINCSVTRLFYNDKKISLSYFNDHSYLDVLGQQAGEQLITYR